MCRPGWHAVDERDPNGVADRWPAVGGSGHHGRHPVRFEPAGDQHGVRPGVKRSGGRRGGLRCGTDEPGGLWGDIAQGAELGSTHQPQLLRALRVHVAVRGFGADRRPVGHHPARHRRVRRSVPGPRSPCMGRGPLRYPDRARRSADPGRGRQRDRRDDDHRARRGHARDDDGVARQPEAVRSGGRRAHGGNLFADLGRGGRHLVDDGREGRQVGREAAGSDRGLLPGGVRSRVDADRSDRGHPEAASRQRPDD